MRATIKLDQTDKTASVSEYSDLIGKSP